jgi:hypothetical protein
MSSRPVSSLVAQKTCYRTRGSQIYRSTAGAVAQSQPHRGRLEAGEMKRSRIYLVWAKLPQRKPSSEAANAKQFQRCRRLPTDADGSSLRNLAALCPDAPALRCPVRSNEQRAAVASSTECGRHGTRRGVAQWPWYAALLLHASPRVVGARSEVLGHAGRVNA